VSLTPLLERLLAELAGRNTNSKNDPQVRMVVRARAQGVCEYCLAETTGYFHVDHVIPPALWDDYVAERLSGVQPLRNRRGPDHIDNYAWSCPLCNQHKRQQVSFFVQRKQHRLFDPRQDLWQDHFVFQNDYLLIKGITDVGKATELALKFNDPRPDGPLAVRHREILTRHYPPAWARSWVVP
jgi:hypothetical protein